MGILEKIEALRKERGLSQGEVESMAPLPQGRISKWKDGKGVPDLEHVRRLAKALQCSVAFLADDEISDPAATPRLTELQQRVLWAAEYVGYDEALRRIMKADESKPSPRGAGSRNVAPKGANGRRKAGG